MMKIKKFMMILLCVCFTLTSCSLDKINSKMERHLYKQDVSRVNIAISYKNKNMWDKLVRDKVRIDAEDTIKKALTEKKFALLYHMFENGLAIDAKDKNGNPLLTKHILPISTLTQELYKKMFQQGIDINTINNDGQNLLETYVEACRNRDELVAKAGVKFYLENNAEVREELLVQLKEKHFENYAALRLLVEKYRENFPHAVSENSIEAILLGEDNYVKEHFQDEMLLGNEVKELVFYTAALGSVETLKDMVTYYKVPMDIKDSNFHYLIMAAAAGGNYDTFQYLKEISPMHSPISGIYLDTENNGESLLSCALAGEDPEIITYAANDPEVFPGEGIYGSLSSDFSAGPVGGMEMKHLSNASSCQRIGIAGSWPLFLGVRWVERIIPFSRGYGQCRS